MWYTKTKEKNSPHELEQSLAKPASARGNLTGVWNSKESKTASLWQLLLMRFQEDKRRSMYTLL